MKKTLQISRRGFIKITAIATGYVIFGLKLAGETAAETLGFISLRQRAAYAADSKVYKLRKSQDNPMVQKIYDKRNGFLKDGPCGEKSHELLHTTYRNRSAVITILKKSGIKLKI
jgi:ferredoxin hydrogenase small subunit